MSMWLSGIFIFVCAVLTASVSVQAAEKINFSSSNINSPDGFWAAAVDLNDDGLDEYILKSEDCGAPSKKCAFKIISGEQGSDTLDEFQAYNLLLGSSYSHGVRNLLIFNEAQNDYEYDILIWDPLLSHYVIKE